ncbi:MAG: adenosylcobinamide-phosphate synthase CbiB [Pseudomonadota bacterium]
MTGFAAMMALALALDACIGWPDALYRRAGHPVVFVGSLISRLEAAWNKGDARRRRAMGSLCVVVVLIACATAALTVQLLLPDGVVGLVIGGVVAWPWIAARSLYDHVAAVAAPLKSGDLPAARAVVSMIVGRDPALLDEAGVARAATESLAENASDGVVAPLFWGVVAGLPGLVLYKAVNTMDSMIGHRSARYEDFGKIAARLDDFLNLLPARLTGLLFALTSLRAGVALRVMARDARRHRSPNAGWPEGAMAGALGVRLSGPRAYAEGIAEEPWLNEHAPDPKADDMARGLSLYLRAVALFGACLLAIAVSG